VFDGWNGEVKEDYGEPLQHEEMAFRESDVLEAALKLAEPLGLEINFSKLNIRTYRDS
jgi:prophage tail gpP-like protein